MKLRLRENSIRLRLLQTEVRRLRDIGSVSETITFGVKPSETLIYTLRASGETEKIFARLNDHRIEIFLPREMTERWADGEQIGLYETQKIGGSDDLKIVIEKDFVCADRPFDEDNPDAFPHPNLQC